MTVIRPQGSIHRFCAAPESHIESTDSRALRDPHQKRILPRLHPERLIRGPRLPHVNSRTARRSSMGLLTSVLCAFVLLAGDVRAQEPIDPALGLTEPPVTLGEDLIQSIRVEGLRYHSEESVIALIGQRVGTPVDYIALTEGIRGLWSAQKVIAEVLRTPVAGGIELVVHILREMPVDVEPRFIGNEKIKTKRLLEWAELEGRAELFLHRAERVRVRLIEGYKRAGFHFVEIDVISHGLEAQAPGASEIPDVIFEIREGPKVRVTSVRVRGNDSLKNTGWGFWRGGLFSLASNETKGRGLFRWWGSVFVEEDLDADLIAMRQVYRDRGWLDAKVEVDRIDFTNDRDRAKVHFIVDEGPLYTVEGVRIEGVERVVENGQEREVETDLLFPEAELLALLSLKPGLPFERVRMQLDARALRSYYGARGYLDNRHFGNPRSANGWILLEPDLIEDVENHSVLVVYRLAQGQQRTIREVRLRGNLHTRDRVLRRESSVIPGEVANVTEIDKTLNRITSTGFFSDRQDLAHRDPGYVFVETEDPKEVDVEYQVNEGRVVDFSLSGGVASDNGLVGVLSLGMRNFQASNTPRSFGSTFSEIYRKEAFHGNGESFNIDLAPGTEISFWRMRYTHPDLLGTHFDRWTFEIEGLQRVRRFRTHDQDTERVGFQFARLFGHNLRVTAGPVWQTYDLSDFQEGELPTTLTDSDEPSTFHGFTVGVRHRELDNRLVPSTGHMVNWTNTYYGGVFGGDEDTFKSEVIFDGYVPLGDVEGGARPGFYMGLGVGVAHPFGDTDSVHYGERFFLGGSTTLRGFNFRGVGPNTNAVPIGGETYARATLEYRHPLYTTPVPGTSRRRELIRGFAFIDAGVLDPESFELDLDQARSSIGFGFGLTQPLPLTFNFGFPIQEGEGDDRETFSFRLSFR
ncbi:MAG: outer membrane protein insertion porin family [Chlamydiales bacterium]|jgi:outer membrane protein insertion porin family